MLDKHGIKMTGLKKAAGETRGLCGYGYVEIFYDHSDNTVWGDWHGTHNEWSEYHDSDIECVCRTSKPMTMQQIADAIKDYFDQADNLKELAEEIK